VQTQLQYPTQGLKFIVPPQSRSPETTKRQPYLTTHSPSQVGSLILTHHTQTHTHTCIRTDINTQAHLNWSGVPQK
jgi:hypothetical protein